MPTLRRILVVEDDSTTQQAWRGLMESWGFAVDAAEDGVRALEVALAATASQREGRPVRL